MAEFIRCTDRWGRDIVLTEACWITHILARHPEFQGKETIVAEAIKDPSFVNHDRTWADREIFYRRSSLPYPFGRVYVRVVVRFTAIGEIITAHFIGKPHRKEQQKWP